MSTTETIAETPPTELKHDPTSPIHHIDPQQGIPIAEHSIKIDETIIDKDAPPLNDENVEQLIADLMSADQKAVYRALVAFRISLSETTATFELYIDRPSIVTRFVDLLQSLDTRIIFESLWCLTNLFSSNIDDVTIFIQLVPIQILVDLLSSPNYDILNQALWALGNIASELRDEVFNTDYILIFVQISERTIPLTALRTYAWVLSNLMRGEPQPSFEFIRPFLPIFVMLLKLPELDEEILTEVMWALSYITDNDSVIQYLFEQENIFLLFVDTLQNPSKHTQTATLRAVGNILASISTQYAQQLLNDGVLNALVQLIRSSTVRGIQREAAWALSNIALGTPDQVEFLIESKAFESLQVLVSNVSPAVRIEIFWVVKNVASLAVKPRYAGIAEKIMKKVFSSGWITTFSNSIVNQPDSRQIPLYLDTVENILKYGEKRQLSHVIADGKSINQVDQNNNNTTDNNNNINGVETTSVKRQINLSKMMLERDGCRSALLHCVKNDNTPDSQIHAQKLLDQYFD